MLGDPARLGSEALTERLQRLLGDRDVAPGESPTSALCVATPIYGTRSAVLVSVPSEPGAPSVVFCDGPPSLGAWRAAGAVGASWSAT